MMLPVLARGHTHWYQKLIFQISQVNERVCEESSKANPVWIRLSQGDRIASHSIYPPIYTYSIHAFGSATIEKTWLKKLERINAWVSNFSRLDRILSPHHISQCFSFERYNPAKANKGWAGGNGGKKLRLLYHILNRKISLIDQT